MFWHLLPAPVIEGFTCKDPSIGPEEWLDKKKITDKMEGDWSQHGMSDLKVKSERGLFLRHVWTTFVRNELECDTLFTQP